MTTAPARADHDEAQARKAVLILAIVYSFNYLDRIFLSILAEPIKRDLGLSDTELGLLTGFAFALFYTFCGVFIASLADRINRVRIVAISCAIWSAFTALCGLANGFLALALARIGVGVGEAGGSPPSYSILSDYFPPERRGTALAIYSLGVPVGATLGAAAGGAIASAHGWRAAFLMLGLAGLLLAPLVAWLVREPPRGRFDAPVGNEGQQVGLLADIVRTGALFVRSPKLVLTTLGASMSAFVSYALMSWAPALLIRDKGMGLAELATFYSLVSGLALALGTWLGGMAVDRLSQRTARAYFLVPAVANLLLAPLLILFCMAQGWQTALLFVFGPLTLSMVFLAPAVTVIQNEMPAARRSTASALLLLIQNLIGIGGGPLFVGVVSDALEPTYGRSSLAYALACLSAFAVLAGLIHLLASRKAIARTG